MFEQLVLMLVRSILADVGGVDDREQLVESIVGDLDGLGNGVDDPDKTAAVVDDLLHQFCTGDSPLVDCGDEVVDLSVVGEGMVFTHRLTEDEITDDRLDVSADLAVLDRIAQADGGLHLPDATPLLLHRRSRHGAGRGGTVLLTRSLEGPPGWLSSWAAGSVIGVSAADGYLTIEGVEADDLDDTDTIAAQIHDDLHAAFDAANHGDDSPVFVEEMQTAWLLQGWTGLSHHTLPFTEVVAAAGFEVGGGDIGRPGTWEAHARLGVAIGRIQRHIDHLEKPESAALAGLVVAFDAWREDPAQLPDPDLLNRLRAHPDAAMCLEEELVRADPDGLDLTAFLGAFDPDRVTRRGQPVHDGLLSLAAELRGDATAADVLVKTALAAEPRWFPALDRRIRFLEVRGKVREAHRLLQQTRVPDDRELITMGQRVAHAYPTAGRNEPCPCGSGRKFKQCHLGRDALTPAVRVSWLLDKARDHLSAFDPALIEDIGQIDVDDEGDDAEARAERLGLVELDMVLFEQGGLARFLRARRELLPDEEVRLTEGWITGHRASVFRVEGTEDGLVLVTDQRNGELLRVHPTPGWSQWAPDDLVWCRLLPDSDAWWSSGVVRGIVLQQRSLFLAASAADTDTHFRTVIGDQSERRDLPRAANGHPLVRAFTTWELDGDREAIEAAIDEVATRSERDARADETGWDITDEDGAAAHLFLGETITLGPDPEDGGPSPDVAPWSLVAHANSVPRHRAVEALVAGCLPAATLTSSLTKPFARVMAEENEERLSAQLEPDDDWDEAWDDNDEWDEDRPDANGGDGETEVSAGDEPEPDWAALLSDPEPGGMEEVVAKWAKLIAVAEDDWCSTAVPELGDRSPLEAVADPERLPDVRTLLREMDRRESVMSPERLRTRLGLDEPTP